MEKILATNNLTGEVTELYIADNIPMGIQIEPTLEEVVDDLITKLADKGVIP